MAAVVAMVEIDAAMAAAGQPPDAPLIAWGFDPICFGGERMTVLHIDPVGAPDGAQGQRPIVIAHANGHLLNVNSAMLQLAGIDGDTGVEGIVTCDADLDATQAGGQAGQPTGELQEPAAMHLVLRRVGNAGLWAFAQIATLQGVTTATDLVNRLGDAELAVLQRCTADTNFAVRIAPAFQAFHGGLGAAQGAARVLALQAHSTDRLHIGLVKMMLDGSIQGFSAWLRWPGYFNGAGRQKPNGIWVTAPAQFEADFETYHRAGLSIHTHTNGDEASLVAIDAIDAIDAIERVLARPPRPDHRHTLQHGQMIDAAMFRRMAALGLCANLFSNHIWYRGDQHHDISMGPDRAHRLNACRSALDAGVALAIHSDAPVTPLAPLFTAWCALNRITPPGRVLGVVECLTVDEALQAITLGAAWTLKLDHEIGSIDCGRRADFVVLEDDPRTVPAMALKDVGVWGTVLGGRLFPAGVPASAASAA